MIKNHPSENVIRLMVVDDHPSVRMGLVSLVELQSDMRVVAQATSGQEAIDQYGSVRPDVVLMDLRMPGVSGVEAIIAILKLDPEARIIVLSTYDCDEDIHRALQSGAKSYLLKDMSIEEITQAVRSVHCGKATLLKPIVQRLDARAQREQLSAREHDVLVSIVRGRSNKEIAQSLFISENTVKTHLKTIFTKMCVRDRTEAVIQAVRHGIIHLDS